MLSLSQRIDDFALLGLFLAQYRETSDHEALQKINSFFLDPYREALLQAQAYNPWFTPENLHYALDQWSEALRPVALQKWTAAYPAAAFTPAKPRQVAIIMAGNLPLVGFHDLLSVLISGHKALIKASSDDAQILPLILQVLVAIRREWAGYLQLADGQIKDFEAVIATGSNNSARYFEHYFGQYPRIVRKNRSSVAVMQGDESEAELLAFGGDVFRYFGLGCRNVSKVYLPPDFDVQRFFKAFHAYQHLAEHAKYGNNYDYNRAIYMMEHQPFLENGFFILREHRDISAPVAVLHYERYEDTAALQAELQGRHEELQCVVARPQWWPGAVAFGQSQKPALCDYADGVDSLDFLHKL